MILRGNGGNIVGRRRLDELLENVLGAYDIQWRNIRRIIDSYYRKDWKQCKDKFSRAEKSFRLYSQAIKALVSEAGAFCVL